MPSIEKLRSKLKKLKQKKDFSEKNQALDNSTALLLNVSSEIVASILVGLGLGGLLDYLFETKPIFIILCLILGCVACFRTIYKLVIQKENQ